MTKVSAFDLLENCSQDRYNLVRFSLLKANVGNLFIFSKQDYIELSADIKPSNVADKNFI